MRQQSELRNDTIQQQKNRPEREFPIRCGGVDMAKTMRGATTKNQLQ